MAKPRVEHHHGAFLVGRDLVQTDWEYPAAAMRCGWNLRRVQRRVEYDADEGRLVARIRVLKRAPNRGHGCDHVETDGTVACGCGVTASDFIAAAADYLGSLAW